jgi:type II secretory pathway component PulK
MNPNNEPVALIAVITTAIVATVNFLGLALDWSAEIVAGLNLVIGGWVAVAGYFVRSRVTPTQDVALTKDDVILIEAGQAEARGEHHDPGDPR